MRILLVEDDRKIAEFILKGLKEAGFAADHVLNGEDGLHLASTEPYDAASIVEDCDRLLQMINTMLDISEAEAGAAKLNLEKADIAEIIQDAIELFQPSAEEKGLTVSSEIPENCYTHVDIQAFQRMVVNLLDNAFKYTPSAGMINIAVKNSGSKVDIVIQDTGIGISQKDLPHIFKRLFRCDASRSQPGFGLGLSLALAIAKSHGGSITAGSSPGKGSTFTITLPTFETS